MQSVSQYENQIFIDILPIHVVNIDIPNSNNTSIDINFYEVYESSIL